MADILIPKRDAGSDYNLRLVDKTTYHAPATVVMFDDVLVDDQTNALKTIDTVHHEVHEGEMWHASYTNSNVANGANLDFVMVTGATKECHAAFEVFAGGQVTVYLYEAPTLSNNGTGVTAYNMKRSHVGSATATTTHTPTVTQTGTTALVNGRILPGGTSATTRIGGGIRTGVEWILAANTKYLLRCTNSSGGAIAINAVVEWYEE